MQPLNEAGRDLGLSQGSTHERSQGGTAVAVLAAHIGVGQDRLLKRVYGQNSSESRGLAIFGKEEMKRPSC